MIKSAVATLMLLLASLGAFAAEGEPSEASIKELLSVMESKKVLDNTLSQVDGMMQSSLQQALEGRPLTPAQHQIIDDMRTKTTALFKQEMSWDKLEPVFIGIYEKSFSQSEVDGMLDFYKSPPGKAVIAKMPLVLQNTVAAMQTLMTSLLPRLQELQRETIARLKATENP